MTDHRRFYLKRLADVSGVSGVGRVADGVQWTDGQVTLHWRGARPSTSVWASMGDMLDIHGHGGSTVVEWLDEETPRETIGDEGGREAERLTPSAVWETCETTDTLRGVPVSCVYRKGHRGNHWDPTLEALWRAD